ENSVEVRHYFNPTKNEKGALPGGRQLLPVVTKSAGRLARFKAILLLVPACLKLLVARGPNLTWPPKAGASRATTMNKRATPTTEVAGDQTEAGVRRVSLAVISQAFLPIRDLVVAMLTWQIAIARASLASRGSGTLSILSRRRTIS